MKRLKEAIYEHMDKEGAIMDLIEESFNTTLYYFNEDEEEYDDNTPDDKSKLISDVKDILTDSNIKYVQKASKIDALLRKYVKMGKNWAVRAMKDEQGNIFLALRQTKESRRPFNLISQVTFSRLAFTGVGDGGIWVYGGDDREIWDDERKEIVQKVLELLGATRTLNSEGFEYTLGDETESAKKALAKTTEEPKKDDKEEQSDKEQKEETTNDELGLETTQDSDKNKEDEL